MHASRSCCWCERPPMRDYTYTKGMRHAELFIMCPRPPQSFPCRSSFILDHIEHFWCDWLLSTNILARKRFCLMTHRNISCIRFTSLFKISCIIVMSYHSFTFFNLHIPYNNLNRFFPQWRLFDLDQPSSRINMLLIRFRSFQHATWTKSKRRTSVTAQQTQVSTHRYIVRCNER